jgi:excisionase family DNA binding protein
MASTPLPANELLTSDEVVQALENDPVLRRLAVACVLPAVRVGDEWRFRRSDLEAWVAQVAQQKTGS